MHVAFYWLEDYFDALVAKRKGHMSRGIAHFLSTTSSVVGDALNTRLWSESPDRLTKSQ